MLFRLSFPINRPSSRPPRFLMYHKTKQYVPFSSLLFESRRLSHCLTLRFTCIVLSSNVCCPFRVYGSGGCPSEFRQRCTSWQTWLGITHLPPTSHHMLVSHNNFSSLSLIWLLRYRKLMWPGVATANLIYSGSAFHFASLEMAAYAAHYHPYIPRSILKWTRI